MEFISEIFGELDVAAIPDAIDVAEDSDGNIPSVGAFQWRDLEENRRIPKAVLNKGRSYAWTIAKEEIKQIKSMLKNKYESYDPSVEALFESFFGSESQVFACFHKHTNVDHQFFLKCLFAFFFSCAHGGLSASIMFDPQKSVLMKFEKCSGQKSSPDSKKAYTEFWNAVGSAKKSGKFMWSELETTVNDLLYSHFLEGWPEGAKLYGTIDDDKQKHKTRKKGKDL